MLTSPIIDRIEVTKGPNAILSPAGAPGGSLNIITKSPTFQRPELAHGHGRPVRRPEDHPRHEWSLGEQQGFRLSPDRFRQDTRQYWSADAKTKHRAFAPMFTWRISDKTQLTTKLVAADMWVFREPALILDPNTTASTSNPKLGPGFSYRGSTAPSPGATTARTTPISSPPSPRARMST
jgi:iron complex outermembrane receptor protein